MSDNGSRVVGFAGSPVEAATGLRLPILQTDTGQYLVQSREAPTEAPDVIESADVEEAEERGLLTRIAIAGEPTDGHIVLYADRVFVGPNPAFLDLTVEVEKYATYDQRTKLYVAYLPTERALDALKTWTRLLLDDAFKILLPQVDRSAEANRRALNSAERANVACPPAEAGGDQEAIALAYLAVASYCVRGRNDTLMRMAEIDFNQVNYRGIKDRTDGLIAKLDRTRSSEAKSTVLSAAQRSRDQLLAVGS